MSGTRASRRARNNGTDPPATPNQVAMRPSPRSSSISELTTPSLAVGNRNESPILANLATNILSPQRQRGDDPPADWAPVSQYDAMDDEEEHDRRKQNEASGASVGSTSYV